MLSRCMNTRCALLACVVLGAISYADAAVIGIDFGARFLKIAAIKPGSGIDMVFNEASKRKSSAAVGFNQEDERVLGDDAYNLGPRLPMRTYVYAKTLLGQGRDSPAVQSMLDMGYPYNFQENATTKSLSFQQDDTTSYLVEELAAFILSYAKRISEAHIGGVVRECVLTVPPFWRASERLALLRAAEIAGLNVLSLVHDSTAVAFKYGFDKEASFVEKPLNVVFYDLGASSLKVSAVQFTATVNKKNKTQGGMVVKGVAWDEHLGGRDFDKCVAEYLADEFISKNPSAGKTLRTSLRGMGKIRKEAERIKEVLSANLEIPVAIEALHEDVDFRMVMQRSQFEKRCDALWSRFEGPLADVLVQAGWAKEDVDKVEVVGGATRIPRVKEIAKTFFGREQLDMSLNGDDACAFGAALYAAKMSTSFRLREFGITDLYPHTLSVRMGGGSGQQFDADDEEGSASKEKVLFKKGSKFPHKKLLSISRNDDFVVDALMNGESYAKLNVTGVAAGIAGIESPTRKPEGKPKASVTFQLTTDGLLEIAKAEVMMDVMETYDEWVTVSTTDGEDAAEKSDPSGDVAGGAASGPAPAEDTVDAPASPKSEDKGESSEAQSPDSAEAKDASGADGQASAAGDKAEDAPKASKEAKGKGTGQDVKKEKVTKTAKRVHHVALKSETAFTTAVQPINDTVVQSCIARNKDMLAAEELRRKDAEAKNRLEAYILDTRDKVGSGDENVHAVSTEKQRAEISTAFEQAEDWLYDEGRALSAAKYAEKENALRKMGDPIFFRVAELEARPAAVAKARQTIETTRNIVGQWATDKPHITEEERAKTVEHADNVTTWLDSMEEEQEARQGHEDPAFTAADVGTKVSALEKAVRVLNRKPKPKPKPETNATNASNETDANATDGAKEAVDAPSQATPADSNAASDGESAKKDEL